MEKTLALLAAFLCLASLSAQTALFTNNGADIYVKDGALMIVKTNSLHNSAVNGSGVFANEGTVIIEGFVKNDGTITAAGDTIRLSGNWINNNTYTGNNSWVEMNGGAQQITGTAVTTFNNLSLQGGSVVKQQTIDAITSGQLALNDAELATDAYEMLITNTNSNAITRNSGFVSSVGTGKLTRATLAPGAYPFPVGSPSYVNPPSIFRPIEISPATAAANTFGAMVVKGDATDDGYPVQATDDLLCIVNPHFYHKLYHSSGSDAAALALYFDPNTDGDWTDQGHWKTNRWNYIGASSPASGYGLAAVAVNSVGDFQPEPFALARKKFSVDAGPDVQLTQGQSTLLQPTITAATVAALQWLPDVALSCSDCAQPTAAPSATTRYTIIVTDNAGCTVSDSLLVTVTAAELLIPTAFSPNGDGANETFRVLNKDVEQLTLEVYNRWGEKVFETTDPQEGWDGFYKGFAQPMGVYVWLCNYRLLGQPKASVARGNVTLVR